MIHSTYKSNTYHAQRRQSSGTLRPGLMKDHGQQARASENVAGPVDFETPRPDLPVHFLNFQKPWLTKNGVPKSTGPAKFSLALACWP